MTVEPTEYRIILDVQTALRAIAVANGYHFDLAALAVKLDPDQAVESLLVPDGPRPFILIEVHPDSWSYSPANRVTQVLSLTIHWVSESDGAQDESRLITFFRGCADVERAIAKDVGRSFLATDTRITKRTYNTAGGGTQVWAAIDVEITTRRVYGQPDA